MLRLLLTLSLVASTTAQFKWRDPVTCGINSCDAGTNETFLDTFLIDRTNVFWFNVTGCSTGYEVVSNECKQTCDTYATRNSQGVCECNSGYSGNGFSCTQNAAVNCVGAYGDFEA